MTSVTVERTTHVRTRRFRLGAAIGSPLGGGGGAAGEDDAGVGTAGGTAGAAGGVAGKIGWVVGGDGVLGSSAAVVPGVVSLSVMVLPRSVTLSDGCDVGEDLGGAGAYDEHDWSCGTINCSWSSKLRSMLTGTMNDWSESFFA